MYGLPAPMTAICAWAKANDVYVIEDAALALGATVEGQPAGSWGDVSIFSFGLGKIADNQLGGAVLTDDARLAVEIENLLAETSLWDDSLMALTNQWNGIYWALHQHEATNLRLTTLYPALYDIYSSLTTYQLPPSYWADLPDLLHNLPSDLAHRETMATLYETLLVNLFFKPKHADFSPLCYAMERGLGGEDLLGLATLPRPVGSILWRYPLLVTDGRRDELLQYLWENGVQDATRWYPSLRHMTAALAPDIPQPPTPNADFLGDSIINLRLDSGVDQAYVEHTAALIHSFYDNL
jgi:dTDP-4-amino-4,6-dideoxygalactose transaminase